MPQYKAPTSYNLFKNTMLLFTDKECGDVNGPYLVNEHNPLSRTLDFPGENELLPQYKASWSSI